MSFNLDDYLTWLRENHSASYKILPDPFYGPRNVPSPRQKRLIFDGMAESEAEMRRLIAEEHHYHEIHAGNSGDSDSKNAGGGSTPTYDPDASAWFSAVSSAGGTITPVNKNAFNTAFLSLKSTQALDGTGSLWSKIKQGYFFIGQESFGAGLWVPFYDATGSGGAGVINTLPGTPYGTNWTGYNSGSYSKTGGIIGDGSSTYFDTGINNNNVSQWPTSQRMGYVYLSNLGSGNYITPFGSNSSNNRTFGLYYYSPASQIIQRANTSSYNSITTLANGTKGWGIAQQADSSHVGAVAGSSAAGSSNTLQGCAGGSLTVSTNITIGNSSASNIGASTYTCAIFGTNFNDPFTGGGCPSSFTLIDSIIDALIASLV